MNDSNTITAPPHASGPEKSILSSMLQNPEEYIGRAIESKLTPAHFYLPSHGRLYQIFIDHFEAGKTIELVALTQHLLDRDLIDTIGGPAALTEIYTYAPTAAHFGSHLEIVKEKFILRNIITSCTHAITTANEDPQNVQEFLDTVEQKILEIRESSEVTVEIDVKMAVGEVMIYLQEFLAGDRGITGISTGYNVLDKMINGLKGPDMFVIAARPSMGKTALMMNIIEHIVVNAGQPAMVFSCEMSTVQIVQRLIFSRARFEFQKLTKGYQPSKGDLERIKTASAEISKSKLFIDDTAGISINDLRAKARRKHRDEGISCIAVDYLQLMRSGSKQAANSREREVAEISAGLKALAKELNIPVIVLAQLNRGPEGRTGSALGVPRMSDLRESGSIEQDADMVALLYRKVYYAENQQDRDDDDGESELVLGKNRNGPTGNIPLTFLPALMRFEPRAFTTEPT